MTKPGGAHAGKMFSRLQRPVGREGDVTRRLKVSPHHLQAPKTQCSHLFGISLESVPQVSQNVQSQAARKFGCGAQDSKRFREGQEQGLGGK